MKAWIDGDVCDAAEARISVLDHGLLYGDGVFEGLRVRRGRIFRLDAHLERFDASARAIGLEVPVKASELVEIAVQVARALAIPESYLRLVATRGVGPLLGEFIGGVAVLVTLVYLAVQMRQTNQLATLDAVQTSRLRR